MSWSQNAELEAVYRSTLVESLSAVVPLWIAHWRGAVPAVRAARGRHCGLMVGHYGDAVLHKAKAHPDRWDPPIDEGYPRTFHRGSPGTAGAFSLLAEGLAVAAYNPGGVTAFDLHWEAHDHPAPPAAGRHVQALLTSVLDAGRTNPPWAR